MTRAFSLIEMMLVVGILAIMAALAVPAMAPQVDITRLEGTAEAVASLVARAQAEAMASKRCVRVRIDGQAVVAERLNVYDCDVDPATAPLIDSSKPLWIEVARARLDGSLTVEFDPAPSETTVALTGDFDQFRFRPSGRLWSADTVITDDDGALKLTHTTMSSGAASTKKVLVEAQGMICVLDRGVDPNGSGNTLSCP